MGEAGSQAGRTPSPDHLYSPFLVIGGDFSARWDCVPLEGREGVLFSPKGSLCLICIKKKKKKASKPQN